MKNFATIIILVIVVAVVIVSGVVWYFGGATPSAPAGGGVACTTEAKLCPDGSYVGRTGPNCEFAACPMPVASSTSVGTSTWQTYTNQESEFTVKYPGSWQSVNGNGSSGEILDIAYQMDKKICAEGVGCSYPGEIFMKGVTKDSILVPYGETPSSNFDDFARQYISGGLDNEATIVASATINGHEAVQINAASNITGPDQGLVPNITELINYSSDSVIWIEVNYFPEDQDYVSQTFGQVLSSLQFLHGAGAFCGGIATGAFPCDPGYSCKLDGTYPDAGGHCVKN